MSGLDRRLSGLRERYPGWCRCRRGYRRALEGEVWTWLDGSAESWGPEPVGRLVEWLLVVM